METLPAKPCTVQLRWAAAVRSQTPTCLQVFNQAMLGFGRNWLNHTAAAGMTNLVVGCADAGASALVAGYGVQCVDLGPYLRGENDTTSEAQLAG